MGSAKKIHFSFNNEIVLAYFRVFQEIAQQILWRPSSICGIKKSNDIISDHLDNLLVL